MPLKESAPTLSGSCVLIVRFEQAPDHSCSTRPAMDSHCHSRQRRLGTSVTAEEVLSVRVIIECVLTDIGTAVSRT